MHFNYSMLSNCNYYIVSQFILDCPNWTLNLYLSNIEYLNRLSYCIFKLQICRQGGLQLQSTSRGLGTDSKGSWRQEAHIFLFHWPDSSELWPWGLWSGLVSASLGSNAWNRWWTPEVGTMSSWRRSPVELGWLRTPEAADEYPQAK